MTPADIKVTRHAAIAARAIYEARVVVATEHGSDSVTDQRLYELEMTYWRRSDELARERTKTKPKRPKRRKAG